MPVTRETLEFKINWIVRVTIPAGTSVVPATNLPQGGFWVETWEGITDAERSIVEGQGIHIEDEEVTHD
tara:strand:+ start:189 stop:395 length:207 start_codon:yes stop_codon:yes gene_type:complete